MSAGFGGIGCLSNVYICRILPNNRCCGKEGSGMMDFNMPDSCQRCKEQLIPPYPPTQKTVGRKRCHTSDQSPMKTTHVFRHSIKKYMAMLLLLSQMLVINYLSISEEVCDWYRVVLAVLLLTLPCIQEKTDVYDIYSIMLLSHV